MGLAPVPHSLHILRAAEVVAVGGLAQPTLLAGPLAGLAALRFGTVMLTTLIAKIGKKKSLQPRHVRRLGLTFIVPETTTKAAPDQSKTNSTEEEPKGKKEEDLSTEEREENPARRKRIFKPANKIQFHSAADRSLFET
jgi:hypothetical protein